MNSDVGAAHSINQAITEAALTGPTLHPWNTGPAVAELQELLNAHGFKLRVDGDFGAITEAAVMAFQKQHGLRVDGVVGPRTRLALKTLVQPGTRTLRVGYTGADVCEAQGLLRVCGYTIPRNGIFCSTTRQAVIDFQQHHKLRETGLIDGVTWTVLRGKPGLPRPPKQRRWFPNIRKFW